MICYNFFLNNGEILELEARDYQEALAVANTNTSGELVTEQTEMSAYLVKA